MRKLPPVNAVRAFEAVARHMQFQAASDELGVTPSALSYQVRQLEEALQVKLFRRLNRVIELTPEGQLIVRGVRSAFEQLEETFSLLQPDEDDNTLVISTGPAFSAKWLAPRLHTYLESAPDLDFRLSASLKLADFVTDGVDAAIRFGGGDYPGLFVEPLFPEISLPLIAPSLFERLGGEANEELLQKVSLLHDDSMMFLDDNQWQQWLAAKNFKGVNVTRGSRFSHADHCIEAAVDGGGMVMGRVGFAFREIHAGRLIAPFDEVIRAKGGFFFCCPEKALEKDKVLHFLAWLRDEAHDQAAMIETFLKTRTLVV